MCQWYGRLTSVGLHVGDWKFIAPATIDHATAQSDLRRNFEHDPFLPTVERGTPIVVVVVDDSIENHATTIQSGLRSAWTYARSGTTVCAVIHSGRA